MISDIDLLDKVEALEGEAANFGFQWETTQQIMDQIKSECHEIDEHLSVDTQRNEVALQEEIGDLLHAVLSLCVFCKLSPHETLAKTVEKFERRLTAVKAISNEKGLTHLQGHSFKELMLIWEEAKKRVNP